MADETTIKLDLTIAGRKFPVELAPDEQAAMIDLVDHVNESVVAFQTAYPSKDKLDCVIMAFLKEHSDILNAHRSGSAEILHDISTLELLLDKVS